VSVARFVASQRTDHGVPHARCCRILNVSESWFYKWRDREPTARQQRRAELDAAVKASFDDSGGMPGTYGSPRVWEDLVAAGIYVVEAPVLRFVPRDAPSGMPHLIARAVAEGLPNHVFPILERWFDIGSPEEFERVLLHFAVGEDSE